MLGRATFLLMASQGFFLISGYAVNVGLARILGREEFGVFGVVMSFLLVVQLFVITGIPIALQKFVAENLQSSRQIMRQTLPWHLIYSVGVFVVLWFSSPGIARLLRDEALGFYLQMASIDIIFYGLYKYFLSMQNGLHQFGKQTATSIAYALSKVAAIFTFVLMGYGVMGGVIGNMLGSIGGLLIGASLLRFPEETAELEEIPFFKFAFTNVFYFVGLQLLFSIDIWFVKYHLSEVVVGEYVSASSVAKIPYFLSLAVSSALLPSISRATKLGNEARVREIVRTIMRYWLMLLLALTVVVSSTANSLIVMFFGMNYVNGGPVLSALFAAIALLTFAAVMNTVLISRNGLPDCLKVVGALIVIHIFTNAWLVPKYGGIGAAYSTLCTAAVASVLSGYFLMRELQVVVPMVSALKMVAAGALVFSIATFLPFLDGQVFLLLKCAVILALFGLVLFASRELNLADIKRFRAILKPGAQTS